MSISHSTTQDRRISQILAVLNENGIASIEEPNTKYMRHPFGGVSFFTPHQTFEQAEIHLKGLRAGLACLKVHALGPLSTTMAKTDT